jgi:hypothetical protein
MCHHSEQCEAVLILSTVRGDVERDLITTLPCIYSFSRNAALDATPAQTVRSSFDLVRIPAKGPCGR